MYVNAEVSYVFSMPQDYEELKLFEANEDVSRMKRTEDTIAVRYRFSTNATYPYRPKERSSE